MDATGERVPGDQIKHLKNCDEQAWRDLLYIQWSTESSKRLGEVALWPLCPIGVAE